KAVAAVAVVFVARPVHAIVEARPTVLCDQVRDDGVVCCLAGNLDLLNEQVGDLPGEDLDLVPETGDQSYGGASRQKVVQLQSILLRVLRVLRVLDTVGTSSVRTCSPITRDPLRIFTEARAVSFRCDV